MLSLFLAAVTVPDSYMEKATFLVIGYVMAAIGWGFRVEMKLAALAREDQNLKSAVMEIKSDTKEVKDKANATHEAVIRIETMLSGKERQ